MYPLFAAKKSCVAERTNRLGIVTVLIFMGVNKMDFFFIKTLYLDFGKIIDENEESLELKGMESL